MSVPPVGCHGSGWGFDHNRRVDLLAGPERIPDRIMVMGRTPSGECDPLPDQGGGMLVALFASAGAGPAPSVYVGPSDPASGERCKSSASPQATTGATYGVFPCLSRKKRTAAPFAAVLFFSFLNSSGYTRCRLRDCSYRR